MNVVPAEVARAPARPDPPRLGPRALLAHAPFRRLWTGQAVSELGDGLTGLAILVLVHRLTGSMTALASLAIIASVPQVAFGLFAGVVVDRHDRRVVMVVSDLLRAGLVAALILVRDRTQVPLLYGLVFAQAAAAVFFEPARNAYLPAVVERDALLAANGLAQSTRVACGAAGAAIAGLLLAAPGGTAMAFGIDAITFVISAGMILSVGNSGRPRREEPSSTETPLAPGAEPDRRTGWWAELVEGLRLIAGSRMLLGLLAAFAITVAGMGAVNVLFIPFMLGPLRASTATVGALRAAQVVGMVLGGAWIASLGPRLSPRTALTGGLLGVGVGLAAMGLAPHWIALLPCMVFGGLCSSAVQSGSVTLLQIAVPDRARGRAESVLDTLLVVVMMGSMAAAGVLGDRFGARAVFVVAGALAAIGAWVGRANFGPGNAQQVRS